ncbi:hypothetical protein [Lonomia obliqua multiple nucleopolyhedrovirus]|uniref:Uncharacterized protein n=1 Tax=Lonomia obliqua multiple nucleopolyhedrovirus TaxID=134394 RepID=A0A126FCA6_9ABAC|nr:hypothetical protein [Lonomia obliqua multiple nucleopolyhedrovirus]AKN81032.1 hypothetical protein [Lonomia obliqua multiple nucleopolyhedrovirus]
MRISNIISKATNGSRRYGNNIMDAIETNKSPTDGDQLELFIERNKDLIKDFTLIICGIFNCYFNFPFFHNVSHNTLKSILCQC